ncbi:MAG: DUF4359 domain-containing protein [Synechococcales bacterium]|nr:DUF4359 domain-containing protein [Synechococcales bacterium]
MTTGTSPDTTSHAATRPIKLQIFAAGLLIALLAGVFTNPGKPAYVDYASTRFIEHLKEDCEDYSGQTSSLGVVAFSNRDLCKAGVGLFSLARGGVEALIDSSTKRQNFGVLSIYVTEMGGREFKTLGMGHHFFTFQSK